MSRLVLISTSHLIEIRSSPVLSTIIAGIAWPVWLLFVHVQVSQGYWLSFCQENDITHHVYFIQLRYLYYQTQVVCVSKQYYSPTQNPLNSISNIVYFEFNIICGKYFLKLCQLVEPHFSSLWLNNLKQKNYNKYSSKIVLISERLRHYDL